MPRRVQGEGIADEHGLHFPLSRHPLVATPSESWPSTGRTNPDFEAVGRRLGLYGFGFKAPWRFQGALQSASRVS